MWDSTNYVWQWVQHIIIVIYVQYFLGTWQYYTLVLVSHNLILYYRYLFHGCRVYTSSISDVQLQYHTIRACLLLYYLFVYHHVCVMLITGSYIPGHKSFLYTHANALKDGRLVVQRWVKTKSSTILLCRVILIKQIHVIQYYDVDIL